MLTAPIVRSLIFAGSNRPRELKKGSSKENLDFNAAAGLQARGEFVVSKTRGEPAELNLRGSGSSSAWCSAHSGSAAARRMFEDPGFLRFSSARLPWSLEQQSSRPAHYL
ncbi:MAG: hypothetical protein IPK68_16930 [Bdellovibrionales bacterium]|nr:hypothetical protein [Bdellovibrionales bacterium]